MDDAFQGFFRPVLFGLALPRRGLNPLPAGRWCAALQVERAGLKKSWKTFWTGASAPLTELAPVGRWRVVKIFTLDPGGTLDDAFQGFFRPVLFGLALPRRGLNPLPAGRWCAALQVERAGLKKSWKTFWTGASAPLTELAPVGRWRVVKIFTLDPGGTLDDAFQGFFRPVLFGPALPRRGLNPLPAGRLPRELRILPLGPWRHVG